jgi:hypothetical protein
VRFRAAWSRLRGIGDHDGAAISATFGVHDPTILGRSLIADIALPVLLLAHTRPSSPPSGGRGRPRLGGHEAGPAVRVRRCSVVGGEQGEGVFAVVVGGLGVDAQGVESGVPEQVGDQHRVHGNW